MDNSPPESPACYLEFNRAVNNVEVLQCLKIDQSAYCKGAMKTILSDKLQTNERLGEIHKIVLFLALD